MTTCFGSKTSVRAALTRTHSSRQQQQAAAAGGLGFLQPVVATASVQTAHWCFGACRRYVISLMCSALCWVLLIAPQDALAHHQTLAHPPTWQQQAPSVIVSVEAAHTLQHTDAGFNKDRPTRIRWLPQQAACVSAQLGACVGTGRCVETGCCTGACSWWPTWPKILVLLLLV
jgi:hypothetical protein